MIVNSTNIITNEKWKIFLGADKLTKVSVFDKKANITYYIFAQQVRFDGRQASQGPTYA